MQQKVDTEAAAERADQLNMLAGSAAVAAAAGSKPSLAAVEEMVAEALKGTYEELLELEDYVAQELTAPECPDPEFWATIQPKCVPLPPLFKIGR
jgi:hypothetical protein